MKTDSDIKRDVEAELKWDPDIDATDIAVAVKGGVVTLTGFVKSYTHKWQAETDAKRVAGVMGVASDIEVRLPREANARIRKSHATPWPPSRTSSRSPPKT